MEIPKCFKPHARKFAKRAKPKTAIITKPILQIDGTEKEHDFQVTYHFVPESEGYNPDIDILKIEWYARNWGKPELKTEIKVDKTYFENELLKLHS